MVYTLCHKDIQVLEFKMEDDEVSDVISILDEKHLPVGVFKDFEKGVSKKQQFRSWWREATVHVRLNSVVSKKQQFRSWRRSRAIPASRQNLRDALEMLGNITTEQLAAKSFGLSLSDQYWAKPVDSPLTWKDVNFFENDFSDDVGKALFGTLDIADISSLSLLSPDNTSDGWLKKKWIMDNGERVLLKGGSGTEQQEPFNEAIASEICKRLKVSHVEYSVAEHDGRYYSACKDFITGDTELVSAWHIKNALPKGKNESEYAHFLRCCEAVGIKNMESIKKQLCQMFTVDCIIANSDRHFNNFGFVRDAATLDWQGLAPVFDSGTSLFHDVSAFDLKNTAEYISKNASSKPFAKRHLEQLEKLQCKEYCGDLRFESLSGISAWAENLLEKNRHLSEKKDILCKILEERVRETENAIFGTA